MNQRRGQWMVVAGGLLLGTLGVFAEEAAQDPITTVWCRCAFGMLALTLYGAAMGRLGELRMRGPIVWSVLLVGVLTVFNWAMFFASITRTSIGVATVVVHMQPLWVLALGAWWLCERVTRAQWWAALAALAGLILATGLVDTAPGQAAGRDTHAYLVGVLMCVGGSFSYACVTLLARSSARSVSAFALAWWQCLFGTLVLLAWPLLHGWPQTGASWAWLAGLGVIHTGLAYVLLYGGMAVLPAARVAVLQFVYPATAVVVDAVVYGRLLSPIQIVGVFVMAVALLSARRPPG